jgi:hypothetical protein
MRGAIPPLPQYVFMAWCLVKRSDSFTLPGANPAVLHTSSSRGTCLSTRKTDILPSYHIVSHAGLLLLATVLSGTELHYSWWQACVSLLDSLVQHRKEGVSKSFRTESITTINTLWEATQRFMAAKLTRLTHKIAIQLHLLAESYIICISRSRRPVRKLLDTPSHLAVFRFHNGNNALCWISHMSPRMGGGVGELVYLVNNGSGTNIQTIEGKQENRSKWWHTDIHIQTRTHQFN